MRLVDVEMNLADVCKHLSHPDYRGMRGRSQRMQLSFNGEFQKISIVTSIPYEKGGNLIQILGNIFGYFSRFLFCCFLFIFHVFNLF